MSEIISSNVTVMVSNMDVAITFYTQTLGLKLKNRHADHFAEVEAPGVIIALHPSKEIKTGTNMSIALGVKDLDQSVAAFEKKGIKFYLYNEAGIRLAFFTDPDGNTLYLAPVK